jgi:hypothetical protein
LTKTSYNIHTLNTKLNYLKFIMGHTNKFDEDVGYKSKSAKHAPNKRGKGMRIINRWSEEEVHTSTEESFDDEQHYANTSQTSQYTVKGK